MDDQQREREMKNSFNSAYACMVMFQRALVIPCRHRFGVKALGKPCAYAFGMMLLWAAFSRDPFMWWWCIYWFIFFLRRKAEAKRLERSGARIHSLYDGWPWDAVRIGRTEKIAKLVVEPILYGVLSGLLFWFYIENGWSTVGLPLFFAFGTVMLPFVEMIKQTAWQKRLTDMKDGQIEQKALVEDFRDKWGDS